MSILAGKLKACLVNNVSVTLTPDEVRQFYDAFEKDYTEVEQKLEVAKQRELELLAVIETMRKSVGMVISAVDGGVTHMIKDSLGETLLKEAFALSEEPSKALREHEAKVLEEFGDKYAIHQVVNIKQLAYHEAEERRKR